MQLPDDATADQVFDAAIAFDECLIKLYRQVLAQQVDEQVRSLFESFLRAEVHDEVQLKKIKAMHYL